MVSIFSNLLISSPNDGGLFYINNKEPILLDDFSTTGLHHSKKAFLRAFQSKGSLCIVNNNSFYISEELGFSDTHDLIFFENCIYLVSTHSNEIFKINLDGNVEYVWKFSGETDSKHINCLAEFEGRIIYSAFGNFTKSREYKNNTFRAGLVRDLLTDQILIDGLSQPHSPTQFGENLLVANSELMELCEYDSGFKLLRKKAFDGYTRGICVSDNIIYLGLSKSRNINSQLLNSAVVVALDPDTWIELGRVSLPTNEIYSISHIQDVNECANVISMISKCSCSFKNEQITTLNTNKKHLNQELVSVNQELVSVNQELVSVNQELRLLESKVANLYSELDISKKMWIEVMGSNSWRITAPLRFLSSGFKKMKNLVCDYLRITIFFTKKICLLILLGRFEELLKISKKYFLKFIHNSAQSGFSLNQLLKKNFNHDAIVFARVDIVIPVYNGYEYLKPMFDSLLKNTHIDYRLIVIDDASSDSRVVPLIEKYSTQFDNFLFLRNNINQGFVIAVNKAITNVTSDVFILMNTDVVVPAGWTERLIVPIIKDSSVASVTPFSNSATICSFPEFNRDNQLYLSMSVEQIDKAFAQINQLNPAILLPTAVGFCMAINRKVVDEIGFFDEIFGKGYGEENDWCLRAEEKGYRHVLANNLFVYHKHGGSFCSDDKKELIKKNHQILLKRYPYYDTLIAEHIKVDPAKSIRDFAKWQLLSQTCDNGCVLIIDHNMGGGANQYRDQKISHFNSLGIPVFILVDDAINKETYIKAFSTDISDKFILEDLSVLENLIDLFNITQIIYNNAVNYNYPCVFIEKLSLLKKKKSKIKLRILIHDFFPICPSYTLLDSSGAHCGVPDNLDICVGCLKSLPLHIYRYKPHNLDIKKWRSVWKAFLEESDEIICFSNNSKKILAKAYPSIEGKVAIEPHNVVINKIPNIKNTEIMHICIVGGINFSKGADVVSSLAKFIEDQAENIKITVIGEIDLINKPRNLIVTGRYDKEDLANLIEEIGANIFLFPSVWPETFSYVTEELILMKVPVACFNIGAPAERIMNYELGCILNSQATETLLAELKGFFSRVYLSKN